MNGPRRRKQPLYVIPMALALILAAFAGAALGLIWQNSGSEEDAEGQGAEGGPTPTEGSTEGE